MTSIPLQPPLFVPTLPNYPEIAQVCHVYSGTIGSNVYPAYVSQYDGSLAFRDRESCYVYEPNGVVLAVGQYDCRLIGSYLGVPIFATTCCP